MEKVKRSYFLPAKLLDTLDAEAKRQGYVREKILAASMANFLRCGPEDRAQMFEQLDQALKAKTK
jgi:hypothetical protein